MNNVKKIGIAFVVGLFVGVGILYLVGAPMVKELNNRISAAEEATRTIAERLGVVQGNLDDVTSGIIGIANEVGGISTEISATADAIGSVGQGIEAVIAGLENSIRLIGLITYRVVNIEAIISGIVPATQH